MKEERSLLKEGYTGCHISIYLDLLDQVYLFRLFLTFPYNLTLSAFESQFLNSMELSNSCKRWSLLHLKRAWKVPIFNFLKINKEFARAQYQIFIPGWKIGRLYRKFEIFIPGQLNRVEISTRYIELNFLHVITMSFYRGVYCLAEIKF